MTAESAPRWALLNPKAADYIAEAANHREEMAHQLPCYVEWEPVAAWHLAEVGLWRAVAHEMGAEADRFETGDIPYVWQACIAAVSAYLRDGRI